MVKDKLFLPLTTTAIFVAKEEYEHQSNHRYFVYLVGKMFSQASRPK